MKFSDLISEPTSLDEHIYFPLSEIALKKMEIKIGPNMSKGQRELLDALLYKYKIGGNRVSESRFFDEESIS